MNNSHSQLSKTVHESSRENIERIPSSITTEEIKHLQKATQNTAGALSWKMLSITKRPNIIRWRSG